MFLKVVQPRMGQAKGNMFFQHQKLRRRSFSFAQVRVAVLPHSTYFLITAFLSALLAVFLFLPLLTQAQEAPAADSQAPAEPAVAAQEPAIESPPPATPTEQPAAPTESPEPVSETPEPVAVLEPLVTPPSAPEEGAPSPIEPSGEPPVQPPTDGADESVPPPEVMQDTRVDLGTEEARVLPDSPLYIFKRGWRGFREAMTFDPLKKAELKVKNANAVIAEVQQVFNEKGDDAGALDDASRAIEGAQTRLRDIAQNADELKAEGQGAEELVRHVFDAQIKQQKAFDTLESRIGDEMPQDVAQRIFERVGQAKDSTAEDTGLLAVGIMDNPEAFARITDEVLRDQPGSEFKEIKNLEVLKRVEEHVPEEARVAIRHAQDNALKRFTEQAQSFENKDEFQKRFQNYTQHIAGDETNLFEVIDDVKRETAGTLDPAVFERMKDTTAERFAQRLGRVEERFEDEEFRKQMQGRMFKRFEEADGEALRTIMQLQERIETINVPATEEIQQKIKMRVEEERKKSVDGFKQAFTDDQSQVQVRRFEELSRQLAENPDPVTFQLLQDLEAEVKTDPSKRAFVEQTKQRAQEEFKRRFAEEGDQFINQVVTDNPRHIEVLQGLQERFGQEGIPAARLGIERALERQSDAIRQRLESIENPEEFDAFKQRFNAPDPATAERIRSEILRRQGDDFAQFFVNKEMELGQRALEGDIADERFRQESGQRFMDERGRMEEDLQGRLERAQTEGEIADVQIERAQFERTLVERQVEERSQSFRERLQENPFCDAACRAEETQRFREHLDTRRDVLENQVRFDSIDSAIEQFRVKRQGREEGDMPPGMPPVAPPTGFLEGQQRDVGFESRFEEQQGGPRSEGQFEGQGQQRQQRQPGFEGRMQEGQPNMQQPPIMQAPDMRDAREGQMMPQQMRPSEGQPEAQRPAPREIQERVEIRQEGVERIGNQPNVQPFMPQQFEQRMEQRGVEPQRQFVQPMEQRVFENQGGMNEQEQRPQEPAPAPAGEMRNEVNMPGPAPVDMRAPEQGSGAGSGSPGPSPSAGPGPESSGGGSGPAMGPSGPGPSSAAPAPHPLYGRRAQPNKFLALIEQWF